MLTEKQQNLFYFHEAQEIFIPSCCHFSWTWNPLPSGGPSPSPGSVEQCGTGGGGGTIEDKSNLQQGGPLPHWGRGDEKMTFRQRASPLCLCLCLQSIQANLVPTMGRSRESLLQSSAGNQLLALHCSGCRAAACGRRGHNNARHRYNREREVQGLHCFRYFSRQCKFEHNWTLCLTLASCHGQAGRSIEFSMTFLGVNVHTFTDSFLLKLS